MTPAPERTGAETKSADLAVYIVHGSRSHVQVWGIRILIVPSKNRADQ